MKMAASPSTPMANDSPPKRAQARPGDLLSLWQYSDVAWQVEQLVTQALVEFHRIREHLVDLLAVALAPDIVRPLHAAVVAVTREGRHLGIHIVIFLIAALVRLLGGKFRQLIEV